MKVLTTILAILFFATILNAEEIRVAAASDLQFLLKEVAVTYEKETQQKVTLIFGSSGSLYAQIQSGAPFDVFFSADTDYPTKLHTENFADKPKLYARGQIVLWIRNDSGLDLAKGLDCLIDAKKIAVANPEHAPYGRAAISALQHAKVYEKIKAKLVYGENVSQAASFLESGAAPAGIISLSLALHESLKKKGRYWLIPLDSFPVMNQAAVIPNASEKKKFAEAFVAYLLRTAEKETLQRHGFLPPVW